MKKRILQSLLGFLLFSGFCSAQQTVGLFQYDTTIADGFTLFSPTSSTTTYLINNCGHMVNTWASDYMPGLSVELTDSGHLYRAGAVPGNFSMAGGFGGVIEKFDWNGDLLWQYLIDSDSMTSHHDFHLMPNGNLLVLVWKKVDASVAIDNGRDPGMIMEQNIWEEVILELRPKGKFDAEILWEWHAMDHLIQDKFSNKKNYGVVADHPELFNFNSNLSDDFTDWLHFNSIDYNADLDQILVSGRSFSEIYIIDHSTSTSESSGHIGGNGEKGGDIIYRWGNPIAYNRGTSADQKSFHQHDATWIPKGFTDAGKIIFFNNGTGRNYSSIEIINPPLNSGSHLYSLEAGKPFQPSSAQWTYQNPTASNFYSANMGGVHRLKTGNTVVCESNKGRIFEIDKNKKVVWEYVAPINFNGSIKQGVKPGGNGVFRAIKYPSNYGAFKGRTLVDGAPLEIDPLLIHCDDTTGKNVTGGGTGGEDTTSTSVSNLANSSVKLYPNPTKESFIVESKNLKSFQWSLINSSGAIVNQDHVFNSTTTINVNAFAEGVYTLRLMDSKTGLTTLHKIIVIR